MNRRLRDTGRLAAQISVEDHAAALLTTLQGDLLMTNHPHRHRPPPGGPHGRPRPSRRPTTNDRHRQQAARGDLNPAAGIDCSSLIAAYRRS